MNFFQIRFFRLLQVVIVILSTANDIGERVLREDERVVWNTFESMLNSDGGCAFPPLVRFLSTNDSRSVFHAMSLRWAYCLDGWDIFAKGDADMLGMTRTTLNNILEHDAILETSASAFGLVYLAQKGGANDLMLMYRYMANPSVRSSDYCPTVSVGMPTRILQMRVAGTNIVSGVLAAKLYPSFFIGDGYTYTTNSLALLPSVANTGPQAAYVYQTFMRVIFKEPCSAKDGYESNRVKYIPPEMLTMRVWFYKQGKPVADVDLSKYGVSVSGLGFATSAPPNVRELKPVTEVPKYSKPTHAGFRSWAFAAIGVILSAVAITAIYFKRRR